MKRIKLCHSFDKKTFLNLLLNIQSFEDNLALRPIDAKILVYLLNLHPDDYHFFYTLFKTFEIDHKLTPEASFNITKLFLKNKNFDKYISSDQKEGVINTLNELKLNLFKKKVKVSTILGAFELFYSIRTNRINIKKYSKYRGLIKSLLSENHFNAFSILFFNEIEIFCDNSYDGLKNIFTNNVEINNNSNSKGNNEDLSNNNHINNNKFLDLIGLKHIKEDFARLVHLTNLLKKYNAEFSDFICNKKRSFYLGSYRLCFHMVSNCIQELQKKFAKLKIREKCETLINKNLDTWYNSFEAYKFYDIDDYFYSFFNEFQYIPLNIKTWSNYSLSISKFIHILGHFMENLLPYSDLKLTKTYNGDVNEELNPTSFEDVYKKLKTKKTKKILVELNAPFNIMKQSFELGSGINWKKLESDLSGIKKIGWRKLESRPFNDKNELDLLFFVKNLNDIIFKTFEDFIFKLRDSFDWVFNNEQTINMEKKDALESVNQIKNKPKPKRN